MKVPEFVALAPSCIVCGAKMKRSTNDAPSPKSKGREPRRSEWFKYYHINMQCTRAEKCFGYMSNAVSIHDPIEVKKFYIGFPKIQIFSVVPEYTQVMANGSIMKIVYIPFESWLRAKG